MPHSALACDGDRGFDIEDHSFPQDVAPRMQPRHGMVIDGATVYFL